MVYACFLWLRKISTVIAETTDRIMAAITIRVAIVSSLSVVVDAGLVAEGDGAFVLEGLVGVGSLECIVLWMSIV